MSKPVPAPPPALVKRRGFARVVHAGMYSVAGLRAAWSEPAFRQEAVFAGVLLPLACWVGTTWLETSVLAGVTVLVLIVELLNTAVEVTVDRVGLEWHALSKKAKDFGSAAVLISLLLAGAVWAGALYARFIRL